MQRFCIRTKASHIVLGFPHRLACALLTAALFSGCSILNSGDGKVIDYVSREPVPHAAVELSCSVPRRGHGHDTKILRTESGPDGSFHFDSKDIGDCTFFDARGIKDGYGLDHMTDVLTRPDLENYSRVQKFVYLIKENDGMMKRAQARAQRDRQHMDEYVRQTAASGAGSAAEEIARGKELLDHGVITQAEFDVLKTNALTP